MIGVLALDSDRHRAFEPEDLELLKAFTTPAALLIERRRLVEANAQRLRRFEVLARMSTALRTATHEPEMLAIFLSQTRMALDAEGGAVVRRRAPSQGLWVAAAEGGWSSWLGDQIIGDEGICQFVVQTGRTFSSRNVFEDCRVLNPERLGGLTATVCVPFRDREQTGGVVWLGRGRPFQDEEILLLEALAELVSYALQRLSLHEATLRQARQLKALLEIDRAISSTSGVEIVLDSVCRQARLELGADAAGVLLLDETSLLLQSRAAVGFQGTEYSKRWVRVGEDLPGQVALDRRVLVVPDLRSSFASAPRATLAGQEGFSAYAAAPLTVKGVVKGVLELFWKGSPRFEREEREFLERLALQCAIGVENTQLFERLQRSNVELILAYDATIEGWARALELRDKETEGHTRRVTELTVELARAAGMEARELIHVRRGAILHDIGKMAIPDEILLKAGPLTEEEWAIMRQHPVIAYQLLSSIPFLRPALDIPYCHHEKWDGSGYPRGLRGDAIPLAARLFAVVDVWDALSSRRPYRDPWPRDRVRAYLREESGRHFDPRAVELFLELLAKHPSGASWH